MAKRRILGYALCALLVCAFPVLGQVLPTPPVEPVPIPGGDIVLPLFNQLFPGVGAGFDSLNVDPHGITNFWGVVAMVTRIAWPPTTLTICTRSLPTSAFIKEMTSEHQHDGARGPRKTHAAVRATKSRAQVSQYETINGGRA